MSETIANVQDVYQMFLSKITDDMYMELTEEETADLLSELFHNALHQFEFPRVDLYDFDEETGDYNCDITKEEMNIIATYMVVGWLDQQLANIELVRMKYSGSDFKLTSQASHIAKLTALKTAYQEDGFHLQRLYCRRKKNKDGKIVSTFGSIMGYEFHD
jgi:hypothetical protein